MPKVINASNIIHLWAVTTRGIYAAMLGDSIIQIRNVLHTQDFSKGYIRIRKSRFAQISKNIYITIYVVNFNSMVFLQYPTELCISKYSE